MKPQTRGGQVTTTTTYNAMNSVPTWLEARLLSKVKSHLEAGEQIEDLDILSGGPVQAIKFLSFGGPENPVKALDIWALVSDPVHTVIVKFDRVAVQRFEKARREAKRPHWTLTSSVGGIFNLRKIQTRLETPPETVCKRADMLRGLTLVLYVPDFAYIGSEGEPRFWHNTQPLWAAQQLRSIRRAFDVRTAQHLNRQIVKTATAANTHKHPQHQPQLLVHQTQPITSPHKALQAQSIPSEPSEAQELVHARKEAKSTKRHEPSPVKATECAPVNAARTRHTNAAELLAAARQARAQSKARANRVAVAPPHPADNRSDMAKSTGSALFQTDPTPARVTRQSPASTLAEKKALEEPSQSRHSPDAKGKESHDVLVQGMKSRPVELVDLTEHPTASPEENVAVLLKGPARDRVGATASKSSGGAPSKGITATRSPSASAINEKDTAPQVPRSDGAAEPRSATAGASRSAEAPSTRSALATALATVPQKAAATAPESVKGAASAVDVVSASKSFGLNIVEDPSVKKLPETTTPAKAPATLPVATLPETRRSGAAPVTATQAPPAQQKIAIASVQASRQSNVRSGVAAPHSSRPKSAEQTKASPVSAKQTPPLSSSTRTSRSPVLPQQKVQQAAPERRLSKEQALPSALARSSHQASASPAPPSEMSVPSKGKAAGSPATASSVAPTSIVGAKRSREEAGHENPEAAAKAPKMLTTDTPISRLSTPTLQDPQISERLQQRIQRARLLLNRQKRQSSATSSST